ncbi:MAG: hypothetical protein ACKVU1_02345 [bacterium]
MRLVARRHRANGWRVAAFAALWLIAGGGCARAQDAAARPREPIVGLPCEGCELVFEGMPATIATAARIAPATELGEPLRIEGTVVDGRGKPAAGVIVYAYHTDARGLYPPLERARGAALVRHGRIRGWALTDASGRYRFDTIRPASYPESTIPQHVHMHIIEVGRCTYWIDDLLFADDPHLTAEERDRIQNPRGGPGIATPQRDSTGCWIATRDIVLGANVPGYLAP